jgi:site-specific DNA-methyltransferase (adenine-specific)
LLADAVRFDAAGLRYAQDIIWRKANGTGFSADRFKRVHEIVVQYYRCDALWRDVFNDVQRVPATTRNKSVQLRHTKPKHTGAIGAAGYQDDGTRIMKSVIELNSVRGGLHRTEKPVELLAVLIRTSCPPGGLVGDFFAGSGAAGEAAGLTGRNYVGCEIDPRMAIKARERLAALP